MGSIQDAIYYTYGNSNWGDLLTAYDGKPITYDTIGNPLTYDGWTFTWEHGRELASMAKNGTTWSFTYDANGLRTKRTNGTTTYQYVYNGSKLTQMSVNGTTVYFAYHANGHPDVMIQGQNVYHYITNLRGDVMGIVSEAGQLVVSYEYDAWGNVLEISGSMAETLGELNPLRYRGYVYDHETELYYLQSRYYNPEWGRFLNADRYASTGQGSVGCNMFAYCLNNPVCYNDSSGELTDGQIHDSVLSAIMLEYWMSGYYGLSMTENLIYYNGENIWGGFGYCDLYDVNTGEVWELKKQSNSYTCTTQYAKKQLGKYVNGRLMYEPELDLYRGQDLVFGKHTYTVEDKAGTYTITYWQECVGILRYSYTFKPKQQDDYESEQRARLACILVVAPVLVVGFCCVSVPAVAASVPVAIAFAA